MSFWKGFKEGFKLFGDTIANIVNFVLLFIAYYIGVGLTSIFMKLFGKHVLILNTDKKKKSYWQDHPKVSNKLDDYYRQF